MPKTSTVERRWFYKGQVGYIVSRFHEYRQYLDTLERKFQEDIAALEAQCEKDILERGDDRNDCQDVRDYYGEQIDLIESLFLRTFRYTALSAIYTFLESSLEQICEHLRRSKNFTIELSDLNGKGIKRAQLYLEKVAGIDFPKDSHAWQEIEKFNKIRNCIVHAEGNVTRSNNKSVLKIVHNTCGLSLKAHTFIHVDRQYTEGVLANIGKVLDILYDEIGKS